MKANRETVGALRYWSPATLPFVVMLALPWLGTLDLGAMPRPPLPPFPEMTLARVAFDDALNPLYPLPPGLCATGGQVYLTNMFATVTTNQGIVVSFDMAGGIGNVIYDILMTTNLLGGCIRVPSENSAIGADDYRW